MVALGYGEHNRHLAERGMMDQHCYTCGHTVELVKLSKDDGWRCPEGHRPYEQASTAGRRHFAWENLAEPVRVSRYNHVADETEIVQFAKEHPYWTFHNIGQHFGLDRKQVSAILKEYGVKRRKGPIVRRTISQIFGVAP